MSRRTLRRGAGALAVAALLLLAAPAQAWGPGQGDPPAWRLAWAAVVDLWVAAQDVLGLRAVVAADGSSLPPAEGEQADDPTPVEPAKGEQGGGVDPDGIR